MARLSDFTDEELSDLIYRLENLDSRIYDEVTNKPWDEESEDDQAEATRLAVALDHADLSDAERAAKDLMMAQLAASTNHKRVLELHFKADELRRREELEEPSRVPGQKPDFWRVAQAQILKNKEADLLEHVEKQGTLEDEVDRMTRRLHDLKATELRRSKAEMASVDGPGADVPRKAAPKADAHKGGQRRKLRK